MEFSGVRMFPITELGLSQMYLSKSKIKGVLSWFNKNDMSNFNPLPVRDFGNGKYTLTDGHSRACVAYELGVTHIPIIYDNDDIVTNHIADLLYKVDIIWCERYKIYSIADLACRKVSHDDYVKLWHERCDRSYNLITLLSAKQRESIEKKHKELFLYGTNKDKNIFYFEDLSGNLFEIEDRSHETQKRYHVSTDS